MGTYCWYILEGKDKDKDVLLLNKAPCGEDVRGVEV